MTSRNRIKFMLISAFILLVVLLPCFGLDALTVEIPVTMELQGLPYLFTQDYRIVIEADDKDFPMPQGSKDGRYTMLVHGEKTQAFPTITYTGVGLYTYRVYQVWGSDKTTSYDQRAYLMKVYILNDGDGLSEMISFHLEGDLNKSGEISFANIHHLLPKEDPTEDPVPISHTEEEKEEETKTTKKSLPPTGESDRLIYSSSLLILLSSFFIVWDLRDKDE